MIGRENAYVGRCDKCKKRYEHHHMEKMSDEQGVLSFYLFPSLITLHDCIKNDDEWFIRDVGDGELEILCNKCKDDRRI